jgi:hypothetical protein
VNSMQSIMATPVPASALDRCMALCGLAPTPGLVVGRLVVVAGATTHTHARSAIRKGVLVAGHAMPQPPTRVAGSGVSAVWYGHTTWVWVDCVLDSMVHLECGRS